jgi:hypothetical protein
MLGSLDPDLQFYFWLDPVLASYESKTNKDTRTRKLNLRIYFSV